MRKNFYRFICVFVITIFAISTGFANGTSEKAEDGEVLIGGSIFTLQYNWFLGAKIGMENWAKDHPDAKVKFQFEDAMQDVQTNIQVLENLATAGCEGIVVFPVSSTALIPTLVNLHNERGIKFVIGDYAQQPTSEDDIVWETFVGHDMLALGQTAGEVAVEYLDTLGKDNPTCLWISVPTSGEVSSKRVEGFKEVVLAKYPNARIIEEGDTGGADRNSSQTLMENILQREATIDVVAGHNDAEVLGAYNAAVGADRDGDMKFIGLAGDKEVLSYISEGNPSWIGEILQDPVILGYTAMDALWMAMNGTDLPDSYALPKPEAITPANIANSGWEDWQWL